MEYRKYRSTGIETSLLGLGCMRFPTHEGTFNIDYDKAQEIVDYAFSKGINYYDTAYVYNEGDSEKFMGQALKKYPRDSYYLATKLPDQKIGSREEILETFNTQLERLQTDYFDFYLNHNINEGTIDGFCADYVQETLEELRSQGKIRYIGFSSHGKPETLKRFAELKKWDFAQIQLNYLDWTFQDAKAQYEILTELSIPVMVMEPVRGGKLADMGADINKLFTDYAPDKSVASWAVRYAASFPNVQVVLSGMSDLPQIKDNISQFEGFTPVNADELAIMEKAAEALKEQTFLPCTGCRYCVDDCPQGIDIPMMFKGFNEYKLSKAKWLIEPINSLPEENQPKSCVSCGSCSRICPQAIDIPKELVELSEVLASKED